MAKRKRAKSWDEYKQSEAKYAAYVEQGAASIERVSRQDANNDNKRWMQNKSTVKFLAQHQDKISPQINSWYQNNPYQPGLQSDGQQPQGDQPSDDQLRESIAGKIRDNIGADEELSEVSIDGQLDSKTQQMASEMQKDKYGERTPGLVKFLETLGSAYQWTNYQATHPFTTALMLANPEAEASITNGNPMEQASKAWDQSAATGFFEGDRKPRNPYSGKESISIGQAAAANPFLADSLLPTPGEIILNGGEEAKTGDPNSEEMQDYFHNNPLGRLSSGTADFAQQSLFDGMTIAAKALKVTAQAARLSTEAGRFTSEVNHVAYLRNSLDAHDAGVTNAVGEWRDWLVKQTGPKGEAAIRTELKRRGVGDAADLANSFAKTEDPQKMNLLLRASWTDAEAIKELRGVDASAYAEATRRSAGQRFLYEGGPAEAITPPKQVELAPNSEIQDQLAGALDSNPVYKAYEKQGLVTPGEKLSPVDKVTLDLVEDPKFVDDYVKSVAMSNPELAAHLEGTPVDELSVIGRMNNVNLGGVGTNLPGKIGGKIGAARVRMQTGMSERLAESDFAYKRGARGEQVGASGPTVHRYNDSKWAIPLNIIRWGAREKPNYLVATKGISKEGSTDEIQAILNAPDVLKDSRFAAFKNEMMAHWGANSHLDATASGAVEHIEYQMMHAMATEYAQKVAAKSGVGIDDPSIQRWISDKMTAFKEVQNRRSMAQQEYLARGYLIDNVAPSGPELIKSPELSSHLRESVPVLDMKKFESSLRQSVADPDFKWTTEAADKTSVGGKVVSLNQSFQSVWRPAVLLRAAYPVRNTVEGYSRVLGFVGLTGVIGSTNEAIQAALANTGRRTSRVSGGIGRAERRLTSESSILDRKVALWEEHANAVQGQIDELQQAVDSVNGFPSSKDFNHGQFIDDLRATDLTEAGPTSHWADLSEKLSFDLDGHLNDIDALARTQLDLVSQQAVMDAAAGKLNRVSTNRRLGTGELSVRLGDGTYTTVNDAFEGKLGDIALNNASNDASWAYITGSAGTRREAAARSKLHVVDGRVDYDAMNPQAYEKALMDTTNKIFRDNAVTQMRLDPNVTSDMFWGWFSTRPGRLERAAQKQFGRNVDDETAMKAWFESGRENLAATFPDERFRNKIAEGTVNIADVRSYMQRMGDDGLPPIIGDVVFDAHGTSKEGMTWWRKFTGRAFHYLGAVPENTIVRQPYYRTRFMEYMDTATKKIDSEIADDTDLMAKITNEAHRYALRRLRRDIYTIQRQKNLPSMVENISPFWTAQLNTATTWPRIFMENPEALSGLGRTYTRMREANMIDDEGYFNPIPGIKVHGEWTGGMNIRIPFTNVLSIFAGQTNEAVENLPGGQFASFFLPNAGPQLQVIISEMQKGTPGFAQIADVMPEGLRDAFFSWGNSLGPSTEGGSWDKLLPTYGRNMFAAIQGEGNGTYDAWAAKILAAEWYKFENNLRDKPPDAEEINDLTRKLFAVLAVGAFTAPGSPRADSPLEPIIQKARDYQSKYGYIEGTNKFLDVYGDESAAAVMHGTKNQLGFGVQQSRESWKLLKENPKLIEGIVTAGKDPELVSMLMGAGQGDGKFDSVVRRLMQQTKIPGSDKNMLEAQSPQEMIESLRIQRGWREFARSYTTWKTAKVDAWVKKYGSEEKIPSEKWATLKTKREEVVSQLSILNPQWKQEYNADPGKGRRALTALREIRKDEKFWGKAQSDPYWQKVAEFIDLHDEVSSAIGSSKPKFPPQTPDEFFAWNEENNRRKGYKFSADKQATYRDKIMKEFNTPGTDRFKQWELAKYQAKTEKMKRENVRFADMHNRWFKGEAYDDNAF